MIIKENLNIYQKAENLNLAIAAASKVRCIIVNRGANDFIEGQILFLA